jgi:hypothetical protein
MSPDWSAKVEPVPYSKLDNPQTLNLYAYVGNNPLSRTDPTGHKFCDALIADCTDVDNKTNHGEGEHQQAQHQTTPAATVPLVLPPLTLPSLEGVAGKLLDGFIDLVGDAAVPLVILANPASTATEAQDTIQSRRPTADVRGQADQAATDANGNLRCSYCDQVLTPDAGNPNSREYDHVTPHSQGGGRTIDNIKDACRTCNRQKGLLLV